MSRVNDRACVHERATRLEEPGERRTRARATSAEAVFVTFRGRTELEIRHSRFESCRSAAAYAAASRAIAT
jgi:hypothetical protein